MSSGRRFSYASIQPQPQAHVAETPPVQTTKNNFFTELGSSDKYMYGIIGVGIIIAVLLDVGVHTFKKCKCLGLDRLQINGRVYVPLP